MQKLKIVCFFMFAFVACVQFAYAQTNMPLWSIDDLSVGELIDPTITLEKTVTEDTCPGVKELVLGYDSDFYFHCFTVTNSGTEVVLDVTLIDVTFLENTGEIMVSLDGLTDEDGDGTADDLAIAGIATARTEHLHEFFDDTIVFSATVQGVGQSSNTIISDTSATSITFPYPFSTNVSLEKTVFVYDGQPIESCPTVTSSTEEITVSVGTTIAYCFKITNQYDDIFLPDPLLDVMLNDSVLGVRMDDLVVIVEGVDVDGDGEFDDLSSENALIEAFMTATVTTLGTISSTATVSGTGQVTGWLAQDTRTTTVNVVSTYTPTPVPTETPISGSESIITLEKTVTDIGACPGAKEMTITYNSYYFFCFTITNSGTEALLDVALIDPDIPRLVPIENDIIAYFDGLTDEDGDGEADDLAIGSVANAMIEAYSFASGTFTNTATAEGVGRVSGQMVSDTSSAGFTILFPFTTGVTLEKTVFVYDGEPVETCPTTKAITVTEGTTIGYCFTITNDHPFAFYDLETLLDVSLTDPALGVTLDDLLIITAGTDEDGDGEADDLVANAIIEGIITTTVTTVGRITNTAIVSGTGVNLGSVTEDESMAMVNVTADGPSIEIIKTADPSRVVPGDEIIYTYNVINTGSVTLTNIVIYDDVLGEVTLTETTLAPGNVGVGSVVIPGTILTGTLLLVVDEDSMLINTATVTGTVATGGIVTDTDTVEVRQFDPTTVSLVANETVTFASVWEWTAVALVALSVATVIVLFIQRRIS